RIAGGNNRQYDRMATALGAKHLDKDERYATNPARNQHREQLRAELEHYLQHNTASRWVEELREAGIPCSEVFTIDQGVEFASEIGLDPVKSTGDEQILMIKLSVDNSCSHITYEIAPPTINEEPNASLSLFYT